jgi:hypothetical protein
VAAKILGMVLHWLWLVKMSVIRKQKVDVTDLKLAIPSMSVVSTFNSACH